MVILVTQNRLMLKKAGFARAEIAHAEQAALREQVYNEAHAIGFRDHAIESAALTKENATLRQTVKELAKYAVHKKTCDFSAHILYQRKRICKCGLDAALNKAQESK